MKIHKKKEKIKDSEKDTLVRAASAGARREEMGI